MKKRRQYSVAGKKTSYPHRFKELLIRCLRVFVGLGQCFHFGFLLRVEKYRFLCAYICYIFVLPKRDTLRFHFVHKDNKNAVFSRLKLSPNERLNSKIYKVNGKNHQI